MKHILLVWLPLVIAYGTTLMWVVDRWNAPTLYYQHGWLVPFIAAAIIFYRRPQWLKTLAVADRRALWLFLPGLFMHLCGAMLMIDSLSASSLVLTVPGAAWLTLGRERLRGLWPVLFLALFAVPSPMYIEGRVSFMLKEFAVSGGAGLANWLGAGVTRVGANLNIDGTSSSLYVADACGGLRSLMAMMTLGYCVAFFIGSTSAVRRVTLLLVTVPLAVTANVVRIAALCLMGRWFGVEFAEGIGHTLANVCEWVADVSLLLLLDGVLSRRFPSVDRIAVPAPPTAMASATSLGWPAVMLWLLCGPFLFLSLYRPAGGSADRATRLPLEVAGYGVVARNAEQQQQFERSLPRWIELLGTSDFIWRHYRHSSGAEIRVVALFHDANWKSVHPPRICIEGSNMDILRDDLVTAPWLDDGSTLSRIVAKSRSYKRQYLTLSVFGTADWSSGSYSEFTWHHLPLAVLRRSQSGFLFRVETPMGDDEDLDSASQRCVNFLAAILPPARELLK